MVFILLKSALEAPAAGQGTPHSDLRRPSPGENPPIFPPRPGGRFGQISSFFGGGSVFSEQTPILIWGAVFVSVPKNTLISRAPGGQGVRRGPGEDPG